MQSAVSCFKRLEAACLHTVACLDGPPSGTCYKGMQPEVMFRLVHQLALELTSAAPPADARRLPGPSPSRRGCGGRGMGGNVAVRQKAGHQVGGDRTGLAHSCSASAASIPDAPATPFFEHAPLQPTSAGSPEAADDDRHPGGGLQTLRPIVEELRRRKELRRALEEEAERQRAVEEAERLERQRLLDEAMISRGMAHPIPFHEDDPEFKWVEHEGEWRLRGDVTSHRLAFLDEEGAEEGKEKVLERIMKETRAVASHHVMLSDDDEDDV